MLGRQRLITLTVLLVCAAVLLATVDGLREHAALSGAIVERPTVLVDAGHGGFDGGAVAPDGTQEKDINLAVAKELSLFLTLCGYDVRMTRQDDTALCEDESLPIRDKKRQDMKRRLALYEQADMVISIHQNMFGASQYHGAQVFYSYNNPLSLRLATLVREEMYAKLQPDNKRELKVGDNSIYLLYKTTRPTVLVECGFLSNPEELALLTSSDYQYRLSFAMLCGVLRYTAPHAKGGTA